MRRTYREELLGVSSPGKAAYRVRAQEREGVPLIRSCQSASSRSAASPCPSAHKSATISPKARTRRYWPPASAILPPTTSAKRSASSRPPTYTAPASRPHPTARTALARMRLRSPPMGTEPCFQLFLMWQRGDHDSRLAGCEPGAHEGTDRIEKMCVLFIHQKTMAERPQVTPGRPRHKGLNVRALLGAPHSIVPYSARSDQHFGRDNVFVHGRLPSFPGVES